VDIAKPGENVKLVVKGLESAKESDVGVGNVICDPSNPLAPIQEFIGQFLVLDNKPIFTIGYAANLHSHCVAVGCTLTVIHL
jgi:translation elongation factor EF-1alpha